MRNGFFGIAFRVFLYIWFAIAAYFFLFSNWLNNSTLVYLFDAGRITAEDIVLYREGRFERLYLIPQFLYLYLAESLKGLALTVVFAFLGIAVMYILKITKMLNLMADLKGGSLRGMNIANGAFPRPPKVPKYSTLESFEIKQLPKIVQDWINSLNPSRKKLALAVLSMMKQSSTPATIHSFGHGGMSVYEHTLLVLTKTLESYEKFLDMLRLQYAIKDKYFGFLGLCALCHDLGKLETYKKEGDGYIQVKADHCWQSGHILNRMDEFWDMDTSDQTNLRQVVQYVEKPWALRDDTEEIVYRIIEFLKTMDVETARTESKVTGSVGNAAVRKGQVTLDDLKDEEIVSTFISLLKVGETVHTSNPKMNWGYKIGQVFFAKQDRFLTRLAVELGDESLAEIKDGSGTRILAARLMNKMQEMKLAPEIVYSEKSNNSAVKYKGSRLWFLIKFADADGKVKAGNEWHYTTIIFTENIPALKTIEDSWVIPTIQGSHQAGSLSNLVSEMPAVAKDGKLIAPGQEKTIKTVDQPKTQNEQTVPESTDVEISDVDKPEQKQVQNIDPFHDDALPESQENLNTELPELKVRPDSVVSAEESISTPVILEDEFGIDLIDSDPFADTPMIVKIPSNEELEGNDTAGMLESGGEKKTEKEQEAPKDKRLQRMKPPQPNPSSLLDLSGKKRSEITEQQKKDMSFFVADAEISSLELSYLIDTEKPYEKDGKFGVEYTFNESKLPSFGLLKYTGLPDAAYQSPNNSAVLVVPEGKPGNRTVRLIVFGRKKSPF